MSDFSDFTTAIAEWSNRQDWSPVLVTSFVRNAEEKLNAELRIDRMIETVDALIVSRCAPLPDDWLEMDFVRIANDQFPSGFQPIEYKPRHEFFSTDDDCALGIYTIEGRQIFIGGPPDAVNGQTVRLDYYSEVPVFSDDTLSWVYTKYQSLYRYAALMHADLHAIGEEQTSSMLKQLCEDMIQKLNAAHFRSRASGSRLARTRTRSFG
ncbi:MAG TPA: hypothetical protein VJ255_19545 [Candidatus Acidoferrum sp.]|nr:hypothetical protein [Candidatus Acidoferrum sp.]